MTRARKAGFGTEIPSGTCKDKNCPFHGTLKIRGKQFAGKIVSDKMQRSVTAEWVGWKHVPKYERYKKTKTRVIVHNPQCVNAVEGDIVKIGECRPLSKTKNFVVLKVLGKEDKYEIEKEAMEEGKHKDRLKEATKKEAVASAEPEVKEPSEPKEEVED